MTTRAEHLEWCKRRALEYVDAGEMRNAVTSMFSDLRKHPETEDHPAIQLGMMLRMAGKLDTARDVKSFIEGFN